MLDFKANLHQIVCMTEALPQTPLGELTTLPMQTR